MHVARPHPLRCVRPFVLTALLPLLASCFPESLPEPMDAAEVSRLGITQGIGGRAAARGGDCMPGMMPRGLTCRVGPLSSTLKVLSPEPRLDFGGEEECFFKGAADYLNVRPRTALPETVAELRLGNAEVYALRLDAGQYQVVMEDSAGCLACVGGFEGAYDPEVPLRCRPIEVQEGTITPVNLIFDRGGY